MKLPRRTFLHLAAGAAALPAVSRIARAQTYPTRPVRMIVPYAPGGPSDVFGRLISQKLSEHFGRQFYVENVGGAGGNIGMGQGLPAKSVSEFVTYAKANPGKINMASAGNGSVQHVSGELFKMMTGISMVHVPYRGDVLAEIT